ncbi:MAG: branched-chain amino acid ABC transporter substrate-binding protein [Nitrospirae bacterium]|nr:branched-chain amino acid ABC transporter substrate-binding protein [Nitrospirota bacterium]
MFRKLLLSLFSVLVLLGCTREPDTLRIGVAGPMTGDQAKMGMDFRNGVTLAMEEWNSQGGLLDKKIELLIEDDQRDHKQAVSIANKLVNQEIAGIIGHLNSSCSIPASDIYDRAGIPMITPASTNPQFTDRGYAGVFRVCGRDDQQGRVGAEFIISKLKTKRIAVIHDKTTYGQGLADELKKFLGDMAEVVYYGGIIQGDKDFKTVLTAIKNAQPELVFFGGIYTEAGLLVKQAKEIGLKTPFMSGDGVIDPKFIEIAGDKAAEGTYLTFSPDPVNIPSAKMFIDKYLQRFGVPGPYSIYAYDAMNILLTAIENAETTDGKKVIAYLHINEFSGALGKIKFDAKGDVTDAPYVVWITKDGTFAEYWKPPVKAFASQS